MSRVPSAMTMQWKGTTQPASRVISPRPTSLSNDVTVPRMSADDLADGQLQYVGGACVFQFRDQRVDRALVDDRLDRIPAVGELADSGRFGRGQHREHRLEVVAVDVQLHQHLVTRVEGAEQQ